jgi:hypothetical protein
LDIVNWFVMTGWASPSAYRQLPGLVKKISTANVCGTDGFLILGSALLGRDDVGASAVAVADRAGFGDLHVQ